MARKAAKKTRGKPEKTEVGRAKTIETIPPEINLDVAGHEQQMLVLAHYADGAVRDVTREAVFSSNNGDVAEVKDGLVKAIRRGEAAILIRYEGLYAANLVTVMGDRTGFKWVEAPENNFIDKHIYTKLQKMKMLPSDLCSDAESLAARTTKFTFPPRN